MRHSAACKMLTAKWSELYAYNAAQIKAATENTAYSGSVRLRADISLTDEIALTKAVTIIGSAHGVLAYSAKLTMENMTFRSCNSTAAKKTQRRSLHGPCAYLFEQCYV